MWYQPYIDSHDLCRGLNTLSFLLYLAQLSLLSLITNPTRHSIKETRTTQDRLDPCDAKTIRMRKYFTATIG